MRDPGSWDHLAALSHRLYHRVIGSAGRPTYRHVTRVFPVRKESGLRGGYPWPADDVQSCEVAQPGMAMNSELPVTEVSQEGRDLVAERLAYSVDEVAQLTGLSRDLLYDRCGAGICSS
jgi:hypothetical protein